MVCAFSMADLDAAEAEAEGATAGSTSAERVARVSGTEAEGMGKSNTGESKARVCPPNAAAATADAASAMG